MHGNFGGERAPTMRFFPYPMVVPSLTLSITARWAIMQPRLCSLEHLQDGQCSDFISLGGNGDGQGLLGCGYGSRGFQLV